jgi:hypothetical protein
MITIIVFLVGAWAGLFCLGLAIVSQNTDIDILKRKIAYLEDNAQAPLQDGPYTGRAQGAALAIKAQAAARQNNK